MNLSYIISFLIIPMLLAALFGFILGWLFFRNKGQAGDLSLEGEGALKAEADKYRAENQDLRAQLAQQESSSNEAASAAGAATLAAKSSDDDETYALEWRNRYLAARVKYLEGRITEGGSKLAAKKKAPAKKKAASKTTAAKKAPTKKAPAKKAAAKTKTATKTKAAAKTSAAPKAKGKPGPKPGSKRGALTASGAPRKKPGPKPGTTRSKAPKKSDAEVKLDKYYANVKKYDASAKRKTVENIVKYCGVSLRSRDSSLVACSDESELNTVAKGFVTKKLGKTSGQMELVKEVCQDMKGERFKSRVTFYYLAAKKARKMSLFN